MLKPTRSFWILGIGFVAAGGLLLADSRPPVPAPARSGDAKTPLVVALQQPATQAAEGKPADAAADRGWIGVMLEDANGQGARVVDVFPGGPAAFARVRGGDVVTKIGGTPVSSAADATTAVERLAPRQQATIVVNRRGKPVELKVQVDSLTDFRERYVNEMMRRDPRHPKYAAHPGISESDMSAEVVRRLFEQHERMERSLHEVLKELHELRQEVRALKK
jgi:membrane-associated protease RseP (regulator of RpoE activity)